METRHETKEEEGKRLILLDEIDSLRKELDATVANVVHLSEMVETLHGQVREAIENTVLVYFHFQRREFPARGFGKDEIEAAVAQIQQLTTLLRYENASALGQKQTTVTPPVTPNPNVTDLEAIKEAEDLLLEGEAGG